MPPVFTVPLPMASHSREEEQRLHLSLDRRTPVHHIGGMRVLTHQAPLPLSRLRWRGMLIPQEHGSWNLLLEPVALGCLVAPSLPGALLGLSAVALVLARTPLLRILSARSHPSAKPLPLLARSWGYGWLAVALLGLLAAVGMSGARILVPLVIALPLGVYQLRSQLLRNARTLKAELAGGLALSTSTMMIALAGGASMGTAAVLWVLPALRVLLAILYIRARLRLGRGETTAVDDVLDAHLVVLVVLAGLAVGGWVPALAAGAFAVLGLRALYELVRKQRGISPRRLGFIEVSLGIVFVVMTAAGFRAGF